MAGTKYAATALAAALLFVGTGCASGGSAGSDPAGPGVASPTDSGTPQSLPISASVDINGEEIDLSVARTSAEQSRGLMYVTSMPPNQGMLFPVSPPREVSFWMQNTLIPLDIIYLRDGKVVSIQRDAQPCTADPCPHYPSGSAVDEVLELNGGRAQELGIQIGQTLDITEQSLSG